MVSDKQVSSIAFRRSIHCPRIVNPARPIHELIRAPETWRMPAWRCPCGRHGSRARGRWFVPCRRWPVVGIGGKVGMSAGTWLGSYGYWGRTILGTWQYSSRAKTQLGSTACSRPGRFAGLSGPERRFRLADCLDFAPHPTILMDPPPRRGGPHDPLVPQRSFSLAILTTRAAISAAAVFGRPCPRC